MSLGGAGVVGEGESGEGVFRCVIWLGEEVPSEGAADNAGLMIGHLTWNSGEASRVGSCVCWVYGVVQVDSGVDVWQGSGRGEREGRGSGFVCHACEGCNGHGSWVSVSKLYNAVWPVGCLRSREGTFTSLEARET